MRVVARAGGRAVGVGVVHEPERGAARRAQRAAAGRPRPCPAGSLPWIEPTTSSFTRARGLPTRSARIGRPWADWPIVSQPVDCAGAAGALAAAAAAMPATKADSTTRVEYGGRARVTDS